MFKTTPDIHFCPTCGQALQPGQTECPICGFDLTQVQVTDTPHEKQAETTGPVFLQTQHIKKVDQEPAPAENLPSGVKLFQKMLDQAGQYERAEDLDGALGEYRRALAFAEEHKESDPSLKIAAQTLPQLIRRTEQLLAQPTPPLPAPGEENKKLVINKSRSIKPITVIGLVLLVGILAAGSGTIFHNIFTSYPHTGIIPTGITLETKPVNQLLAAASTTTATLTSIITATPTVSPTPTITSTSTLTPTITPLPKLGSSQISPIDKMVMFFVPAGIFSMGSDTGPIDTRPMHPVTLDAYWIDGTEITNSMYAQCVNAGNCAPPSQVDTTGRSIYFGDPQYDEFPVVYVSWGDAVAYCKWAGRKLPTEAEWEKAARGTDGRTYPWGNTYVLGFSNSANIIGVTSNVNNFPSDKSPYGALDMAGNVWEWVNDKYEKYSELSHQNNPSGPTSGEGRVIRGGSYTSNLFNVRAFIRSNLDENSVSENIGFRCAQSQNP
jgi:formylglycine-generating enzyme required for sulfatase activity/uncharacterized Zn finger protein (UPF0148 family)